MQCSGIHRGLGVHISQVRSTTLDTWQPDQVLRMGQVGNARSNAKYEARLPAGFKRPSHVRDGQGAVRRFIEQKYVQKKWFRDDEPAAAAAAAAASVATTENKPTAVQKAPATKRPANVNSDILPLADLLGDETPNVMDGGSSSAAASGGQQVASSASSILDGLAGLSVGPEVAGADPAAAPDAWASFEPSTTPAAPSGADPFATSASFDSLPSFEGPPAPAKPKASNADIMKMFDQQHQHQQDNRFGGGGLYGSLGGGHQMQQPRAVASFGMPGQHQHQQQRGGYQGYQSGAPNNNGAFDGFL